MHSLSDSYQAILREHNTQLMLNLESEMVISSYQDIIIDTLSQLIDNSLTHAFTDTRSPHITLNARKLGAVDLSGLQFIQFKMDLIAARAFIIIILLKKRATMRKFVLNEP